VRPPLNILIPLGAILMTGVIGVSFGLINIFVHDNVSKEAVLVWASGLTVAIMIAAVILTMSAFRSTPHDD
jgi:hypothetical protein